MTDQHPDQRKGGEDDDQGRVEARKRTSTETCCEFCRQTTITSKIRIAVIKARQARQLTGLFSWEPIGPRS
jgi:hypothetical protein